MTFDLNCLSPCIFEKEDQPGSKYCFAAGDMKVECEDDMDYTPTNRPRPTGEMTEGPDGETDGMTDDGMTEDPNGVTGVDSPSVTPPPANENSCKDKCGSGYDSSLACQCNSFCPQYNNCCSDYAQLCAGNSTSSTSAPSGSSCQ